MYYQIYSYRLKSLSFSTTKLVVKTFTDISFYYLFILFHLYEYIYTIDIIYNNLIIL